MSNKLLFAVFLVTAGCQSRDADLLTEALRRAGQKAQNTLGAAPNQLVSRVRGSISDTGASGRVQLRLAFDKELEGREFEVETVSAGVVRIKGEAASEAMKQRVLDLARSTRGVESVEDALKVPQ